MPVGAAFISVSLRENIRHLLLQIGSCSVSFQRLSVSTTCFVNIMSNQLTIPTSKIDWNSDFVQTLLDSYETCFMRSAPTKATRKLNEIVNTLKTAYPGSTPAPKDVIYHVHLRNRGVNGPKKVLSTGDPYHMFRRPTKKRPSAFASSCAFRSTSPKPSPTSSQSVFSSSISSIFKSSAITESIYGEKRLGSTLNSSEFPDTVFRQVKHTFAYDSDLQKTFPCFDNGSENRLFMFVSGSIGASYHCSSCKSPAVLRHGKLYAAEHRGHCTGEDRTAFYALQKERFVARVKADINFA